MLESISLFINESINIEAKSQQTMSKTSFKNLYFQTELLVSTQILSSCIHLNTWQTHSSNLSEQNPWIHADLLS